MKKALTVFTVVLLSAAFLFAGGKLKAIMNRSTS